MTGLITVGETLGLLVCSSLRHATTADVYTGGAESNVAIGVSRLGVPAAWVGRVGDDPWGGRVLRDLRAEGLALHAVVDTEAPTALMTKERRSSLLTAVSYHRAGSAGSRLRPEDVPAAAVTGAAHVHLTGITPGLSDSAAAAVRRVLDLASGAGIPVSFDVNHRKGVWRDRDPVPVYRELAAEAAVLFAGEDEARLLGGTDATEPADLLGALGALTPGDVVLKRGEHGCQATIDGNQYAVAAVPVRVVDTVGAGDAFVAGYLAELLSGSDPERRLHTAVRGGALACLVPGDWEGLPTRADLAALDDHDPVRR